MGKRGCRARPTASAKVRGGTLGASNEWHIGGKRAKVGNGEPSQPERIARAVNVLSRTLTTRCSGVSLSLSTC